ncbi:glycosyltransferase family 9 protein [Goodfellowiella coeruleoviolacea]|uniref:ADP-heptose:LPS heptosyltransferase n=1 Tax=Goodfellowiella coeruleoviolacea TaxID=334858 RepID=A0AAE3G8Y4_9PSEU|nr:glycosyltransferase family 9 protein [Goodfellowiella coeruleoviolacea]MCP2163750.1 ADP-heptose:LPS heptosyltransferase [Goodfellowiella coeruleoviolacea]
MAPDSDDRAAGAVLPGPAHTGKLVALRALKLGDLLVSVPALRALRRHWPQHHLVLATSGWLAPIVELVGAVDELLPTRGLAPLDARARHPDIVVNLHGRGPRSSELLDALKPRVRIGHRNATWSGPEWVDGLPERERWCRLLTAHGVPADPDDLLLRRPDQPSPAPGAVVLHPGAAFGAKRWPVERFAALARALADRGERVVITGTAGEHDLATTLAVQAGLGPAAVLAGRTSLAALAALVADARLVVSNDTGTAHLSYAYRTPSVVLFGPVPADWWGPPASGPHRTRSADRLRRGDPFAADADPALLGVSTEEVLAEAIDLLDRSDPAGAATPGGPGAAGV